MGFDNRNCAVQDYTLLFLRDENLKLILGSLPQDSLISCLDQISLFTNTLPFWNCSSHFRCHQPEGHLGSWKWKWKDCWTLSGKEKKLTRKSLIPWAIWVLLACEVIGLFKFWASRGPGHQALPLLVARCSAFPENVKPASWGNPHNHGSTCLPSPCVHRLLKTETGQGRQPSENQVPFRKWGSASVTGKLI